MPKQNIPSNRARMGDRPVIVLSVPVEIRAAAEAAIDDVKKGPPSFSMVAYGGGPLTLKGWDYPVVIDQTGWQDLARSRPSLLNHDANRIVGHTTTQQVQDGQLHATGLISGNNEHSQQVIDSHSHGFPWQASVGAKVLDNEFVPEGATALANGQTWQGPINISRRTSLREISFVPNGADDTTSAKVAASAAGVSVMTYFQQWAKAHNLDIDDMDDVQVTAFKNAFKAANPDADPDAEAPAPAAEDVDAKADPKPPAKDKPADAGSSDIDIKASGDTQIERVVSDSRKAMANETRRVTAIRKICAGGHPDIEAKAIEDGWSSDKVDLAVLRANRPNPGAINASFGINTGRGGAVTPSIFAAAAAANAGVPLSAAYSGLTDQEKNIAASAPVISASSSVYGMFAAVAAAHGKHLPGHRMTADVIRAGFQTERTIQADGGTGFTTMSVAGLTENVMNKAMLAAYNAFPTVVPLIAFETGTNDYKPFKRYRLTSGGGFPAVGPTSELKHGTLADESYSGAAKNRGKLIVIPEELMVNDDMGAMVQLPTLLGRDAALERERLTVATLVAGTTTLAPGADFQATPYAFNFFSTGAGTAQNMLTGTGSALGFDGMSAARTLFLQQKDKFGNPIMLMPDRLLVPPALTTLADTLFSGQSLIAGSLQTSGSKPLLVPTTNVFANRYKPIVSPFLGSGSPIPGTTDTGWYLLPDPTAGFAPVGVAYLNNQRTPKIERGELSFDQLGMGMRAVWAFDTFFADFRTAVFNGGV